jgi:transformation/transcription domain-associated protein
LRLLPLPHQVGVVEGLAIFIKQHPGLLPLSDQHLLVFLQDLLKMLSVADGEMNDLSLKDRVINKDGYTFSDVENTSFLTHSSSLFFRGDCVVEVERDKFVIPEELPTGVQLRVATIVLLRSIIRGYRDQFFDAEWIGTCVLLSFTTLNRKLTQNSFKQIFVNTL